MGVFQNNLMGAAAAASAGGGDFYDYQITNSVRLNGTSQALEKTWGSAASNDDAKALSFWIKRSGASDTNSAFGSTTNTKLCSSSTGSGAVSDMLEINTNNPTGYSDQFHYYLSSGGSNFLKAKWRDPAAWMHIVWIYNSDESTTTDRLKVYINGVSNTINDSNYWDNNGNNGYPSSGADTSFGKNGNEMHIGRYVYNDAGWWGGQMADWIMIDGTASISDFGEFKNGVWKPVDPSGLTFGNNGFWLDFKSPSDPGNDASGNNNDFTNIGSIATHDILIDSPTFNPDSNGGNYCTFNSTVKGTNGTLSEGNLKAVEGGTGGANHICTMGASSGKWYWEGRIDSIGAYSQPIFGISGGAATNSFNTAPSGEGYEVNLAFNSHNSSGAMLSTGGSVSNNLFGTVSETETGTTTRSTGDIITVALDIDNKKIWYGYNGSWFNSGNPATGSNPQQTWTGSGFDIFPLLQNFGSTTTMNFGQEGTFGGAITAGGNSDDTGYGDFKYAPPTGFLALCAGNLPTAEEVDPAETDDDYPQKLFAPNLYTGDGASTLTISGMDLQPDLTWIKNRDTTDGHCLFDSTRGVTKLLASDSTAIEVTDADTLKSWTSDGYTVGADVKVNTSGEDYVGWNWRANGGTTTSNGNGSLASVTQTDPSGCFSIGTYTANATNSTIGHGLSVAPNLIILKKRDNQTKNWMVWGTGLGNDTQGYISLNTTGAMQTDSQIWQNTAPTSSVFSVNYGTTETNAPSGDLFVFYAFANCDGYIKTGTYIGNADDDGAFVYTGFRPAMMILREYGAVDNWGIYDNKRLGYNDDNAVLYPDTTGAEENQASRAIDILSNGFKLRTSNATFNASGNYLYLAMAHNPFQYATAR